LCIVKLSENNYIEQLETQLGQSGSRETVLNQITRIYSGRILKNCQRHPLQELLLKYGIATIEICRILAGEGKDIVVFGEPDEVCSVHVANIVAKALNREEKVAFIGQIPLPAIDYFDFDGRIRMYGATRSGRIHLNESDDCIKTKLEEHHTWTLVALALSPLTTNAQLEEIGALDKPTKAVDLLMQQIQTYKSIAKEVL
ncbi:MAG: hypothetical protein Q7K43_02045, partial [Candidatus Woesearchaeota archaeon]|nr:hypothetical protein [Candidatus Woesearchaeota archaeon]